MINIDLQFYRSLKGTTSTFGVQSGNSRLKGWSQKGKESYTEILKQVEKARQDVEKCKAFETTIWKKLRDKHGVTGSNPQENKRNKQRKMAIEDDAPKIEL
jgi:transposase-like protein